MVAKFNVSRSRTCLYNMYVSENKFPINYFYFFLKGTKEKCAMTTYFVNASSFSPNVFLVYLSKTSIYQ